MTGQEQVDNRQAFGRVEHRVEDHAFAVARARIDILNGRADLEGVLLDDLTAMAERAVSAFLDDAFTRSRTDEAPSSDALSTARPGAWARLLRRRRAPAVPAPNAVRRPEGWPAGGTLTGLPRDLVGALVASGLAAARQAIDQHQGVTERTEHPAHATELHEEREARQERERIDRADSFRPSPLPIGLSEVSPVGFGSSSRRAGSDSSAPRRLGATPRDLEVLAASWMRTHGTPDAEVTRYGGDGGVDVAARAVVAQVKHYAGTVGPAPVRELFGVATSLGKEAVFFTSGSYTRGAVEFAAANGVTLYVIDPMDGSCRRVYS